MPPQVRIGDMCSFAGDAHGCPVCPHGGVGWLAKGSPNVLVNSIPAGRIGDNGTHAACCGPNTFVCVKGSGTVLFNNIPAVRVGDNTLHCGGGSGPHTSGSPNVMVGG